MISLDHLLLDNEVLTARFACDVSACKGACCTLPGGAGAPLLDEEVALVNESMKHAREYLSSESRDVLDQLGPIEGRAGDWTTRCIDDKDCVFVAYQGDVATCTLERAFHEGKSTFRKPLSCHLFPIRIAQFGGPYVYYEQFSECAPGRARGEAENISLIESVKDSLIRAFGEEIYNKIVAMVNKPGGNLS